VTGKLPLPAQVFQLWWVVAPEADMAYIHKVFPNIVAANRAGQKRRLASERYRQ
jgi:hypothetical protein